MAKETAQKTARKPKPRLIEMSDGTLRVRSGWAYAYILPGMLLLLLFTIYPLVMVLRTAFYQKYVYITNTGTGFGLSSFTWVLKDPTFWMACKNTLILLLIALPITLILALGFALLINSIKKLQGFFQTIYFLPYVLLLPWAWPFCGCSIRITATSTIFWNSSESPPRSGSQTRS